MPQSSILSVKDNNLFGINVMNNKMIKNFLIIDCTGKNNFISLKVNDSYYTNELQKSLEKNQALVKLIINILKRKKVIVDSNFSILVNLGPGSFSGIRISIAIAKGIQIAKKINIYGYNNFFLYLANYLNTQKNIISIHKTKNLYYFVEAKFNNGYQFSTPKEVDFEKINRKNCLIIIPEELKNNENFCNFNKDNLRYVKFSLNNVDLLIKNNLLQNKLIKPLYLS